jgi:uncharacterized membrane protein
MSFESSRKMGYTASLLFVLTPVFEVVALAAWFIAVLFNATTGSTTSPYSSYAVIGLFGLFIAIAAVAIAAYVLFLIAMSHLSRHYNSRGIFSNLIYALIINIVGAVVAFVVIILFLASALSSISQGTVATVATYDIYTSYLLNFIGVFAAAFVFGVVSAVFTMRAFHDLAEKSGENSFRTAGTLYLVGAVIIGVGGILVWIAWIFAATGYKNLKLQQPPPTAYSSQYMPPSTTQTKSCPYCGAQNDANNTYCRSCGHTMM